MKTIKQLIQQLLEDKESVTFYPTYGFQQGDHWKIPMRTWVHEPRKLVEGLFAYFAPSLGAISPIEEENFKLRMASLVADSESREEVLFRFDNDPTAKDWQLVDEEGHPQKTNLNGIAEGFITLSDAYVQKLLKAQKADDGWLSFRATSKDHSGVGRLQLIEEEGLSVVSDVDDTIKITELPAGASIVIKNTFFRNFAAAPTMAKRLHAFENTAFHYVSGSPWQLFEPIWAFILNKGFPAGSISMKSVPKNLLSPKTWQDLYKVVRGGATVGQKIAQISRLFQHFPKRKFILIGDSGEHDPEIYRQLSTDYSHQIKEIIIRDVVNAREKAPERLEGMTIIEADTIQEGISQLG